MSKLGLMILLGVSLVVRLGWGLTRSEDLAALPDQVEYLELGRNWVSGVGLHFADPRFPGVSYAHRMPGYPALIAMCGGSAGAVRAVQSLIDVGTVLGVVLLARRVGASEGVAGVLAAACPWLVYFSGLVLTETMFTGMLVWGVYLLLEKEQGAGGMALSRRGGIARDGKFLGGLLLLALAVLIRPGAVGLPVVLAVGAALVRPWPLRFPAAGVAALCVAVVLAPWAWRNHQVLNSWVWTSTNVGITAYDGFRPGADGSSQQSFVAEMPELAEMTETQRDDYLGQLAVQELRSEWRDNRWRAVSLAGWKLARTWSPVPLSAEHRSAGLWVAGAGYSVVAWGLALAGLRWSRMRWGLKALLLTPVMYFSVGAMMTVGSLRYRVPGEPFLMILAGAGAAALFAGRRRADDEGRNVSDEWVER